MIFPYAAMIAIDPISGREHVLLRPEVPITIHGISGSRTYRALVDTGADNTVLPKSVAIDLGTSLHPLRGAKASAFGGQILDTLCGEATFDLADDADHCRWTDTVLFLDMAAEEETLLLGHAGFLDYFTAIFDGHLAELTLVPNEDLPTY
jgi:hypothetical protein